MVKKVISNVEQIERRKHWRDRRAGQDRRNPARLRLVSYDCRSRKPRRQSDIGGELADEFVGRHRSILPVVQRIDWLMIGHFLVGKDANKEEE